MSRMYATTALFSGVLSAALVLSACGKHELASTSSRAQQLESVRVFGNSTSANAADAPAPEASPTPKPTPTPAPPTPSPTAAPTPPPVAAPDPVDVPTGKVCGTHMASLMSLSKTKNAYAKLFKLDPLTKTYAKVSSFTPPDPAELRKLIANRKKVPIDLAGVTDPGTYQLLLCGVSSEDCKPGTQAKDLNKLALNSIRPSVLVKDANGWKAKGGAVVLDGDAPPEMFGKGKACSATVDPLMIDLAHPSERASIELSMPSRGVAFDIQGFGEKNQISWPTNPSESVFLALPKIVKGTESVTSVQELFGDSTLGPDGLTASNGFEALMKFDSNADGVIDARDPVFQKLRIWRDLDRNGVSSPKELSSLSANSIQAISLRYITLDTSESDDYGNQTLERAEIRLTSGERRMIFDVWFKID